MWVPGFELRPLGLAASAFTCWAVLPQFTNLKVVLKTLASNTYECLGSFTIYHRDCLQTKSYWTFSVKRVSRVKWQFSIVLYLGTLFGVLGWWPHSHYCRSGTTLKSIGESLRCCVRTHHWLRMGWACKCYCKRDACQKLINTLAKLKPRSNALEAFPLVRMPGEEAPSSHSTWGREQR